MDPTYIEAPVTLSRAAYNEDVAIPFARAVERAGDGLCDIFGGTEVDDCQLADWAVAASVAVTAPAGTFEPFMVHLALTTNPTGAFIAYKTIAKTAMNLVDGAINILMKTSKAVATGDLQIGTDETASFASPQLIDLPAMVADTWYYFNIPFVCAVGDRDEVIGVGLWNDSGSNLSQTIDVQYVGFGYTTYNIAGFAQVDGAVEDDEAVQYDTVNILAGGRITGIPLNAGETCLADQPLYPVPGSGKLSTTEIVYGTKPIIAGEDQSIAGGNVMVVR